MENEKKKISVLIPCYNEEENVKPICAAVEEVPKRDLSKYDYEIVFIDNNSTDRTREYLYEICSENKKVKAILNAKNFGQFNSPYYGMCQTTGDCTISMCADFQDPVDMLPKLVAEWEKGFKIVSAIKTTSKENPIMRLLRTIYYKMIKKMSEVEQIEHFTGFGLYDKSFIEVLKNLNDPIPFLRGIVAELGFNRKEIPYEQQKRAAGVTHNNFYTLYDAAMLSFTSYTKVGLRLATFFGFFISGVSLIVAIVYFVYKLLHWNTFKAGMAPLIIGMFFFNAVTLFFIGLLGEYVLSMNKRLMHRPLVIEEKRLNFDEEVQSNSSSLIPSSKDTAGL